MDSFTPFHSMLRGFDFDTIEIEYSPANNDIVLAEVHLKKKVILIHPYPKSANTFHKLLILSKKTKTSSQRP